MSAYRDKVLGFGVGKTGPGSTQTTVLANEDKPGIAGTVTDHWDGRRDAVAMPDTVHLLGKTRTPG